MRDITLADDRENERERDGAKSARSDPEFGKFNVPATGCAGAPCMRRILRYTASRDVSEDRTEG